MPSGVGNGAPTAFGLNVDESTSIAVQLISPSDCLRLMTRTVADSSSASSVMTSVGSMWLNARVVAKMRLVPPDP